MIRFHRGLFGVWIKLTTTKNIKGMRNFNCYVSGITKEWINLNKINTYQEYLRICDAYFGAKLKQPRIKIILGFDLKQIIVKDLTLSENNFNQFKEYKLWNDIMKDAFNVYINDYRWNITNDNISHFTQRFIDEYESREEFATEYATQVEFIEEWEKVEKYFDIKTYTDELFEDYTDIKHPTKNCIFVFRKQ